MKAFHRIQNHCMIQILETSAAVQGAERAVQAAEWVVFQRDRAAGLTL